MFILSTFVFVLGKDYFEYSLNLETVITIFLFLFCILLGEYVSNCRNANYNKKENSFKYIYIQKNICILLAILVFGLGVIYFLEVYKFSLTVGNFGGNFATMAMYVRNSKMYSKSTLVSQGTLLSECIFYFCIYHKKTNYIMISSIIAAVVNVVLNYFGIKMFGYLAAAYTSFM